MQIQMILLTELENSQLDILTDTFHPNILKDMALR